MNTPTTEGSFTKGRSLENLQNSLKVHKMRLERTQGYIAELEKEIREVNPLSWLPPAINPEDLAF